MSFELDIDPIDNEAADFLNRLHIELFQAFVQAKKNKGVTQRQVAEIMGVDKSQVSRILRGSGNPTARTISDFAFALDCMPAISLIPIKPSGNLDANHVSRSTSSTKINTRVNVEPSASWTPVPVGSSSYQTRATAELTP
ncbi:helix-turn-helix domain-containing protein [Sulfitobacter mediterraneus]|uniref:XRE family transcriptional regulator n=1 Tax=Sulfitobacter mediterraneus TaxID=83219 RepID=A0A061SUB5_9RHOB|nr:helix-turn-helix transcriptional regulator [Sulfitobacter mediterraneus]KAJ03293.1 XRE family transcriptional regulator [Sulfitobacter mediterraneus]